MTSLTHLFLTYKHFLLRQTRVTLFLLAVAVIVVLIGSWQLAQGLFGQTSELSTVKAPQTGGQSTGDKSPNTRQPDKPGAAQKKDTQPDNKAKSTHGEPENQPSGTSPKNNKPSSGGSGATTPPSSGGGSPANPGVARNSLGVPITGTVLTLSGLNYNLYESMPPKLLGIFNKPPYTMEKVEYPASLASDSITKGVASLNAKLRSTPGHKIVLGMSQGSQVASRWMREFANDPTAPGAGDVTFILLGNPLRSTGGYIIGRTEVGGTTGLPTPTNTKWPIIDVARRYDGWADWVKDQSNQWAVDNANAGKSKKHNDYNSVNLYASTHTIWKSGNTTYVLTKEDDLPLWDRNSDYPLGVRTAMRAHIERAYTRPANDPKVQLIPIESPEWENQLREWGVLF